MKQKITIMLIAVLLQSASVRATDCSDAEVNTTTGKIREASRGCDPSIIGQWQYQTLTGTTWTNLLLSQVVSPGLPAGNQSVVSQWITPLLPTGTYLFKLVYANGGAGGTACESDPVQLTVVGGTLPLPPITAFSASKSNTGITLTWKVHSDLDAMKYVVEKNMGGSYQSIGEVAARQTTQPETYTFTETMNTQHPTITYRILMISKDGEKKYSGLVSVKEDNTGPVITVFPTIVQGSEPLQLRVKGNYPTSEVWTVSTVGGQLIFKGAAPSGSINTSMWASGQYVVNCQYGKETITTRIIKQ